jgi:hypothetical protein
VRKSLVPRRCSVLDGIPLRTPDKNPDSSFITRKCLQPKRNSTIESEVKVNSILMQPMNNFIPPDIHFNMMNVMLKINLRGRKLLADNNSSNRR